MGRLRWLALSLVIWPSAAWAEVWEDPTLSDALTSAGAVVRVRAPASEGQPRVRFRVEAVVKGDLQPGAEIDGQIVQLDHGWRSLHQVFKSLSPGERRP